MADALPDYFVAADRAIYQAYPDIDGKGAGWWGQQRIPNWGILRGAIERELRAAATKEIERLREENERLHTDADAVCAIEGVESLEKLTYKLNDQFQKLRATLDDNERLRAELATARREALEEAARVCEDQAIRHRANSDVCMERGRQGAVFISEAAAIGADGAASAIRALLPSPTAPEDEGGGRAD